MDGFMQATALLSSLLVGSAVFVLLWAFSAGEIPAREFQSLSPLEKQRRLRVREAKPTYHNFERLIQDLRPVVASLLGPRQLSDLRQSLQFSSVYQHMEADEFLSLKFIEGLFAGALVGLIFGLAFGIYVGIAVLLIVVLLYVGFAQSEIAAIESRTKNRFLLRLPSSVDLLSLMLEAGATFPEALTTVVKENSGHPLGDQLGQVSREIALGRPKSDALKALRERLNDATVDELVLAINEGEEFGTPLAKILASQAERMRLKRTQWLEKATAEAQVKMSFPSLLIMIACSLVVLGPFVLQAVFQFLGE